MADVKKSVEFTLRAKTAPLEASLKKIPQVTDREARQMVKKLDKAFDKVEKSAKKTSANSQKAFKAMSKGIAGAAVAIAAAGAAMFELNRAVQDAINDFNDLSTTTGISVENLKGLKLAARGSGIEFGVLQAGLNKLPSSMQAAAKGTGAAAEAFDALGVKATNADGSLRDANEVFEEAVSALADIESEAEKAAIAADLFGQKAGSALIQSGAIGSMQTYNDLMREYGVDTGPEASKQAAEFQRALALLEAVTIRFGQVFIGTFGEDGMVSPILFAAKSLVFFGELMTGIVDDSEAMWDNWFLMMEAHSLELSVGLAKLEKGFAWLTGGDTSFADSQIENFSSQLATVNSQLRDYALETLADRLDGEGDAFQKAAKRAGEFEDSVKGLFKTLAEGAAAPTGGGDSGGGSGASGNEEAEAKTVDLLKLQTQLYAIRQRLISDTLSEEEKIRATYAAELEKINEIAELSEGQLSVEAERLEVKARMERELHELRLEQREELEEQAEEIHKAELARIDKERKERIANLKSIGGALTGFASDYATATKTLMENTGQITEEGAIRLFRVQQAAGISDVAISTAAAIMKALAVLGPIAGGIAAGAIGSLGAVQAAAIASQQPPSFDMGGLVGQAGSFAPDEVGAQLLTGEAVLDRSTVRRIGGERGVRALQRGEMGGGVTVISPYKHFDRFITSSMGRNSRLRRMTSSRQKRGY